MGYVFANSPIRQFANSSRGIGRRTAFTMLELMCAIAIMAVMVAAAMPFIIGDIQWAQTVTDLNNYTVFNDMITRCKCEGGNVNAFTVGAPWADIVTTVKTPVNWAGMNHQFANTDFTYPGRSISVAGNGQQYHITRVNSYMPNTTDAGVPPGTIAGGGTITNGLVGWWKLDDGSGNTAVDSSGNGYNGTLVNAPTWTTGKFGGALSFNANSDQSVYVGPSILGQIAGGTTGSLSVWFQAVSGNGFFVGFSYSGEYYNFFALGATNGSCVLGVTTGINGTSFPVFAFAQDGQWHHFCMVFDGSKSGLARVTGYLDGAPQTLTPWGHDPSPTIPSAANLDSFQMAYNEAFTAWSGGAIDDVRVYNRALSATEVQAIYNGQ